MIQHAGTRFLIVALLTLLMALPLFMVAAVIGDRLSTARDARSGVEQEWAGEQLIAGPRIVVPVKATVTTTETVTETGNATGAGLAGTASSAPAERRVTRVVDAPPLILLPESFDLTATADSEIRRRGVFDVPVYTAGIAFQTRFAVPDLAGVVAANEAVQWDDARIQLDVTWNKGLRGEARITRNGEPLVLEPMRNDSGGEGIEARLGDPRGPNGLAVDGALSLRGSAVLRVAPVGRISRIAMDGNWPDPGFAGVLPDASEVSQAGFRAEWAIPNLARTLPQLSRGGLKDSYAMQEISGDYPAVRFLKQNDFYQQAFRATRYAILMIALTFLTVFLVENRESRPAHPVQYILIGLAQSLFVLLMVAYAEHFGFGPAFLGASAATIALLTLFGATALRMGRRTWVMSALLVALYAVLWLILQSVDYALLAGATLAFIALAATMIMTRNENWYGPARPVVPAPEAAPQPADGTERRN